MSAPPPLDAFREEVRTFIEREMDPVIPLQGPFPQADTSEKRVFLEKVGARGWLGLTWSPEYGGRGWGAEYQNVLHQELEYAGLPTASIESAMVGPTLARHGSEELKRRFLPAIASGALSVALGYSEPEAGSDLANLSLCARRDGDDYVLDGQKMWTSAAHFAHVIWLAARTDPDAPKHRGISILVVDANSPGITVSAIETMHDHRTNVVYFEGVRVPRNRLVGEENAGWKYLLEALDLERLTAFPVGNLRRDLDELTAWVRDTPLVGDPVVMRMLAEEAIAVEASLGHLDEAIEMLVAGESPARPATMLKVAVTECRQNLANRVLDLCGPRGALSRDDPRAVLAGRFENAWRGEIVTTIAGGANEIQRDLIARRHLGLPRAE